MYRRFPKPYCGLPNDIRPMGVNNLNQLVYHHLGSNSFDAVAQVRENLPWLHKVFMALPAIADLSGRTEHITELAINKNVLYAVAAAMPHLKEIANNVDTLTYSVSTLKNIDDQYAAITAQLALLQGQITQEAIDNLLEKYNQVDKDVADLVIAVKKDLDAEFGTLKEAAGVKDEFVAAQAQIKLLEDKVATLESQLAAVSKVSYHIAAVQAVQVYEASTLVMDKQAADAAVKASEDVGNDETSLKQRIEAVV